ncbi:MAG: LytTR family DNA-binding domain-containing protein [Bacteroidota bacterium]
MKLTCVAVDDEPLALEKIVDYIGQVPFLELKGQFDDGMEVLSFLQENEVDVLFLDIQMPQLLGTQLVQILKNRPQVIFTTAYSEYAMDGYELDITDYLLKPIPFGRFLKSAQKALERASSSKPAGSSTPKRTQAETIFVKTEFKWQQLSLNDIKYIEGMKDYLAIHTEEGKVLTLMSFNELLDKLPSDRFMRIHKSYVVALGKIKEIEKARVIIDGEPIPIGETYKTAFLNKLKNYGMM